MKAIRNHLVIVAIVLLALATFVYAGLFNVAADDPHSGATRGLLDAIRLRSIAMRAGDEKPPTSLDDPKLIAMGAEHYAEMCTGCHLAPGMDETEIRAGLYPKPPNLSEQSAPGDPAKSFWIIKHGIKMTGMPAWGVTHDDQAIWGLVAFIGQLPGMTPDKYMELTANSGSGHSHEHGDHDEDESENSSDDHAHEHGAHEHMKPAAPPTNMAKASPDSIAASTVVDRFQSLLAAGKTDEAAALLDEGVLIFEGGGAEKSRTEYASHHLGADSKFLKGAKVKLDSRVADAAGGYAWVATQSTVHTTGAKPLHLVSDETMVLKKVGGDWRIVHVHWSSAQVKH